MLKLKYPIITSGTVTQAQDRTTYLPDGTTSTYTKYWVTTNTNLEMETDGETLDYVAGLPLGELI